MTQIDTDLDPVANAAGRYLYDSRRAEGVVEYPPEDQQEYRDEGPEAVPITVEAEVNGHSSAVLTVRGLYGTEVTQYFDSAYALDEAFEEVVERFDLEQVAGFSDRDELLEAGDD